MMKRDLMKKVVEPNSWRKYFYRVVISKYTELFMLACIVINTVVIASKAYPMTKSDLKILDILNYILSVILNIEIFGRLIGLGRSYFNDKWNWF
jgi:hypothetical protein